MSLNLSEIIATYCLVPQAQATSGFEGRRKEERKLKRGEQQREGQVKNGEERNKHETSKSD